MPRIPRRVLHAIACTATLATTAFLTTANAQDSLRTGDGLLRIQAAMPAQARMGEQFTYNVQVMNTSDNVVLHDIKLKQQKTKGLSIESVSMQGQGDQQQSNQNSQSSNSDQQKQDGKQSSQQSQNKSTSEQQGQSSSDSSKNASDSMTISMLNPGESRTFTVMATADEEGELKSCLAIASYTPSLCLTSQVVKPQLELTKTAPKKANRCNMIELTYKVKNGGSGDVDAFTITDSLGEGLATIEGNSELSFDVDGLDAGETREFVARVYARKTGDFSSRAVAKANNSDLKSRSKETTTKVVAADLIANVDGPNRVYGNDLATFTATVTNDGNVAADSVNVTVNWPSVANLVDMSDYQLMMKDDSSKQSSKNAKNPSSQGEPTMAKQSGSDSQGSNQKSRQSDSSQMQMQNESFVIDSLKPGQTAEFTYAIRTDNLEEIPTKIQARYVCTVDAAEDQANATTKTTTIAMATTDVVRLPALQLAVVDDEDPVQNGSKVQYTIQVWNEGDAPDENVQLIAKLPNNLKFDSADGPTELESEGDTVKFQPIKTMEPGARAEFTVTAKPTGSGNARFEASLTSKMLQSEVIGEEPTRLFDTSNN